MSSSTTSDRDQPSLPSLQSLLASSGTLRDISSFHKDTANWRPQDFPPSSAPGGYSHFNMGLQSHSRPAHLLEKIFDRTANDSRLLPGPEPISTSLAGASLTSSPSSPSPSVASRTSVPPSDGSSDGSKKKRKRATKEKLKILHDVFQRTNFPSTELRLQLATKLNMPPRSVQIWFQNQRQIILQNCRSDGNKSGLVDGRKRKSSPSDNFWLSMELDELSSKIESKEASAQSKKPKSDGEASESWDDDSSELSIPDSIAELRSIRSLSSSAGTSSWSPILPLPKPTFSSNWTPSSLTAPQASLQHFVSSPLNPAVVEPTSLPPLYKCVDPKIAPPNPCLPPILPQ